MSSRRAPVETTGVPPVPASSTSDPLEADDVAVNRRIEEASVNAWPAMHQILLDGWLVRLSGGFTKRANCIVPLYPSLHPDHDKVRYCENLYAREKLRTIFRLTSMPGHDVLDAVLDERGYTKEEETLVLATGALTRRFSSDRVQMTSLRTWLDAYTSLANLPEPALDLLRTLLGNLQVDPGFALIEDHGKPVACGMAVIDQRYVGLYDIVTDPEMRRRGLARELVRALLCWGARGGADTAYLQMVAGNDPAAHLYDGLGFRQRYRYWYRVST